MRIPLPSPKGGPSWLLWAYCFGCCLEAPAGRLTDLDASLRKKGGSAAQILTELTSFDDKSNPRLSCSEGMAHARQLVDQKFGDMQLKPLGSRDFRFMVPGTKDEECPDGITNLIGAVEGSDEMLKDEYLGLSFRHFFLLSPPPPQINEDYHGRGLFSDIFRRVTLC